MLQAIREKAQGWFAWIIVILLVIPFALWGIQEYLGGGSEPIAATVDGRKITERELDSRFQQFKQELRERLGKAYRPELFDDSALRREVLDDLIRTNLVLQATVDMGLRAGDDQVQATILGIPAFQRNDRFDRAAYERSLRHQGLTSVQFEERTRYALMSSQLSQVLMASELVTERELAEAVRLRRQQREFSYFILPVERFLSADPLSDEAITGYYQAHPAEYQAPEQVKLEYVVLNRAALAADQTVDEAALHRLYEEKKADFRVPERRQARHILISLAADADQAQQDKARADIEALRNRVLAGEKFASLAREHSQDPGSASAGGDLGSFERGLMDPAFEKAVFSQDAGQLSPPVRSPFGYHFIEVTRIEPERFKGLDEVQDQLLRLHQGGAAERRYYEAAERLASLSYEHPDSLVPAAEALGVAVQSTDWIDRRGGKDLVADPKVLAAAFSDDVMRQGNNSEPIEIDAKGSPATLVLRVTDYHAAAQKPLDEVRDQVIQAVRSEQARAAAAKTADGLVARLRGGEALDKVAEGYELKKPGLVDRHAQGVPGPVIQAVFTLAPPPLGSSSFGTAQLPDGQAILALALVAEGKLQGIAPEQQQADRQGLARNQARAYYDRLVDDLRQRAKVSINLRQRTAAD